MVNDEGHLLHFNDMTCRYNLGPHHRVIWNQVTELVISLVHVPPPNGDRRIQDWMLQKGNIVIPMHNITTHSMYMLLQPDPWIHEHANALWNLHKTQSCWKTSLQAYGVVVLNNTYSHGDASLVCS